jgi:polyhydroxyalkanoate synthase
MTEFAPMLDPELVARELADHAARVARAIPALRAASTATPGCSERSLVWRDGKTRLYRYRAIAPSAGLSPLLIVYAMVNRPQMLDLQPDRSLVRRLLERGLDVYLIDWGYPDGADRFTEISDYLEAGIGACIEHITPVHAIGGVNLLGVCQGGTLSLCYTALHPAQVQNLITMVTPVDFQTPGNLLSTWARHIDVEALVDAHGNVPGTLLNALFVSLLPFRLGFQKYLHLLDLVDEPTQLENFMRMEKWIFDSPDQAGAAFRQFIRWFYQENRLIKGTLDIAGRRVELAKITQPVLNIYANHDHLVPPSASITLGDYLGSRDYTALGVNCGHIGLYTSARLQGEVPATIFNWLAPRERQLE